MLLVPLSKLYIDMSSAECLHFMGEETEARRRAKKWLTRDLNSHLTSERLSPALHPETRARGEEAAGGGAGRSPARGGSAGPAAGAPGRTESLSLCPRLAMEAKPPLYPVAGAAGPQDDEDRLGDPDGLRVPDGLGVPDGPEAPVSGGLGAREGGAARGEPAGRGAGEPGASACCPAAGRAGGRVPQLQRGGGGAPLLPPQAPRGAQERAGGQRGRHAHLRRLPGYARAGPRRQGPGRPRLSPPLPNSGRERESRGWPATFPFHFPVGLPGSCGGPTWGGEGVPPTSVTRVPATAFLWAGVGHVLGPPRPCPRWNGESFGDLSSLQGLRSPSAQVSLELFYFPVLRPPADAADPAL